VGYTGPLCFTSCNLGSIDHIGTKLGATQRYFILTLPRNSLEKLWKIKWRHLSNHSNLISARRFLAEDHVLQHAELTTVKCSSSFQYTSFIHRTTAIEKINEQEIQLNKRTNNTKAHERINYVYIRIFVYAQSTFMTADELLHTFLYIFFLKFRRANRSRTFRTFCHASKINFLQQPVHTCQAQFFLEYFLNKLHKRCEFQIFSWRKTLISARSSLLIFLILNKTTKTFVTYYVYCRSLDGATLFSKVDSNKIRNYVIQLWSCIQLYNFLIVGQFELWCTLQDEQHSAESV